MDANFWGLICVPLGIAICFTPILLAAVFGSPEESDTDKPQKH
jgi:hypothetical protein